MHLYVITNPAKTIIVSVISKHNVPWLKSSLTEVSQCVTIEPKLSKGFEVLALYEKKRMCHGHTIHVLIPELGSWICDFITLLDAQILASVAAPFVPFRLQMLISLY